MPTLRPITVHVAEPKPRSFEWVLSELQSDMTALELARGPGLPTYQRAMAAGLWQLQQLIDDLDLGPRQDTDARSDAGKKRQASKPAVSPGQKAGFFGFGPIG